MRRVIFVLCLGVILVLTTGQPDQPLIRVVQVIVGIILVLSILSWIIGRLTRGRRRPPPSQVAELEKLYFRAMRELLNDEPNLPQVITDLQHILNIDPHYKNARHFLNRALALQEKAGMTEKSYRAARKADFMKLQEKLIDLDPAVRKSVVMELIHFGDIAVDPLTALLMDEDADVRIHAATALGWVGGSDAVYPLLVALEDGDALVRRYAARALCWVVDENAVEGLIAALHDEDTYVRSYTARALGWSGDERAIPPLLDLLEDESLDVRGYARTALEDLGYKYLPAAVSQ